MKGLTHYISGVAAATCFPQAMQIAHEESSFIIVLGGVFGILPDTLDFKFAQFFEHYHYRVDPDPIKPNVQEVADTLAKAINDAHASKEKRSIIFMTIKKGADLWRQYRIFFDLDNDKIRVTMGPLVNTSKKPYPNSELPPPLVAEAKLNCKLCKQVYDKETFVDIMSGPSFQFIPQPDGTIKMDFLSWHRRWSHSLTMGLFLGICGWLLLGLFMGFSKSFVYGMVITAGFWIHILEDQLGYMGSNLFWPFTKEKSIGTKSMHSGDAMPNFTTVWLALAIIFFNMNQYRPEPIFHASFWVYLAYVYIVPLFFLNLFDKFLRMWDIPESELQAQASGATSLLTAETLEDEKENQRKEMLREREEEMFD